MGLVIDDLKGRRVVRVAIRYLLIAVGALCTVGMLTAWLPLPAWTFRLAALAAFTALPFVLVVIWALDDQGPQNLKAARRVR